MFENYLKVTLRNLVRNKTFSAINIIGLSSGMAIVILIALWIWNEVSFDKYHKNYNQIAKVRQNVQANGEISTLKTVPLPLAEVLRTAYRKDFKYFVSSSHKRNHVLAAGEKLLFVKIYLEIPHSRIWRL